MKDNAASIKNATKIVRSLRAIAICKKIKSMPYIKRLRFYKGLPYSREVVVKGLQNYQKFAEVLKFLDIKDIT